MKGGANVSLRIDDIARVRIPVPSISEQQNIIRILQAFEEYCTKSLVSEIEMRKQQTEYYRDLFLTFEENGK